MRLSMILVFSIMFLFQGCSKKGSDGNSESDTKGSTTIQYRAGDIYTNSLGMKFVFVPPGKYTMGILSQDDDKANQLKPHEVIITKGFLISQSEVTQAQYQKVMGENPSKFKGDINCPVDSVSWDEAMLFCKKLGQITGEKVSLPTEAQWEYACRAGTTSDFNCGPSCENTEEYMWYKNNSKGQTQAVMGKLPNSWKIYDMHGNVAEWCMDWYDPEFYHSCPVENPYRESPLKDTTPIFERKPGDPVLVNTRVIRGGSWFVDKVYCSSASRYMRTPDSKFSTIGFRIVVNNSK